MDSANESPPAPPAPPRMKRVDVRIPHADWLLLRQLLPPASRGRGRRGGLSDWFRRLHTRALSQLKDSGGDLDAVLGQEESS